MPPQQGQRYQSLSPEAEADLATDVARILARNASARTTVHGRPRLPPLRRVAALSALVMAAAACLAWVRGRPWRPTSSLRGGSELAEDILPEFCSKVEEDVEFHTQAPLQWKDGIHSADMCCAECDGDPECGAWTYGNVSNVEGLSHRCFLKKLGKDEEPERFKRKGVISGFPSHVLRKHGIVAGMLAKQRSQVLADDNRTTTTKAPGAHAPAAHAVSTNCPGGLSMAGHGRLSVVAAKWQSPGQKAAPVEVPQEGWEVSPRLASRAYLASNCTDGKYQQSDYSGLKLLGRTLRYSVDLSGAGCGCNAQLHLAAMGRNSNKSVCGDYSCGAASGCGASCMDFAVQDANEYAWSSGAGEGTLGVGSGGGGLRGRRDWSDSQYGPGGKCVDTAWPFEVAMSFAADKSGKLRAVELELTQEGERWNKPCSLSARLDKAALSSHVAVEELSEALDAGLTPVISYSGSADLSWLDGVDGEGRGPCVQDSPEACGAAVRFYNFAITDGDELVHGNESDTDASLPEMAMNAIHQHEAKEASKMRKKTIAGLVATRLVDDSSEPCEKDCEGAGSDVMGVMESKVNGSEVDTAASSATASSEYEESASGNSEWEVVSDLVHIRSNASLDAEILGLRQKGDVFVGKRTGGWIRLHRQPGFAPVLDEGDEHVALLKERIVTYEKIVSGTCMDHGLYPIEDPRVCEVAAFTLGYFDLNVSEFKGTLKRPEGCYLYRGKLFISSNPANHGHGMGGGRYPLCSSGSYPITSTTTTSTTTSTTVTTTTTTTWGFPSLFCFEVMMRHTYEYGLVRKQIQKKASIFTCDEYAVFSQDGPFSLGQGPDGPEVKAIWFKKAPVWKSEDNTAANALLFMHVFQAIKKDGRWLKHHWTVKADPDAVLLPWRLREHLRPATNKNNYLVNCNKMNWKPPFPMIFGSLEAYSNKSLDALFNGGMERCNRELQWRAWGEDKYLGNCMKHLGVQPYYDFNILADNRCKGAFCGNPTAAAFHDFKNEAAWFRCWEQATR